MDQDVHQDIGALKAEVASLKAEQAEIKSDIKAILQFVTETRTGRRYLLGSLTVAATLGALVDRILAWLHVGITFK